MGAIPGQSFSVGEQVWHKQSLVLDSAPTTEEAIIYAGLTPKAKKVQLFTEDGYPWTGKMVVTSEDGKDIFSKKNVTDHYELHQHAEGAADLEGSRILLPRYARPCAASSR